MMEERTHGPNRAEMLSDNSPKNHSTKSGVLTRRNRPKVNRQEGTKRNIYQKLLYTRHSTESIDGFGMEHDGNISLPSDLLDEAIFQYTAQQKTDSTAYLLCAVGYTITRTVANVHDKQEQSD